MTDTNNAVNNATTAPEDKKQKKSYYVQLPGYAKGEVWDEDKYSRNKEALFREHPDVSVFERTTGDIGDDIADDEAFTVYRPGFDKGELWDGAKLKRNRDKLYKDIPDIQVSRVKAVDYNAETLAETNSAIAERMKRMDEISHFDAEHAQAVATPTGGVQTVLPSETRDEKKRIEGELTELYAKREENPAYQREQKTKAQFFDDENARYTAAMKELEESNPTAARAHKQKWMQAASQGRFVAFGKKGEYDPEYTRDIEALAAARNFMDEAKEKAFAPSKYDSTNGFANFFRGIYGVGADVLTAKQLMDAGLNMRLVGAVKKIQETEGTDKSLFDLISDPGKLSYLSNAEKELVRAFCIKTEVDASRAGDLSLGYQSGDSAFRSLGFMADFLATGGIGTAAGKAATKGLLKATAKMSAELGLKGATRTAALAVPKFAIGTLEAAVKTAVMSPMMPSTWVNIQDNLLQINDAETLDLSGKAIGRAFGDAFIENLSENAGPQVEAILGGAAKLAGKGANKLFHTTKFTDWAKIFDNSGATRLLRDAAWNGYIGEIGEEWYGNALRVMTGVDPDALKNFATVDQQIITLTSFAPMSVFGGATSAAQYGLARKNVSRSGDYLASVLRRNGYDEAQIKDILDVTKAENPTTLASHLAPVINQIANDDLTAGKEAYKAVMDYADAIAKYRVFDGIHDADVSAQRDKMHQELRSQMGDDADIVLRRHSWMDNRAYATYDTVHAIEIDGKTAYIVGENEEERTVALQFEDGEKRIYNRGAVDALSERENSGWKDNGEMRLDDYLDMRIAARKGAAEQNRMNSERSEQAAAIVASVNPGDQINIGTEEAPIMGTVVGKNGEKVILEVEGQCRELTPDEVGNALKKPISVKSDEDIERELIAHEERRKRPVEFFRGKTGMRLQVVDESGDVLQITDAITNYAQPDSDSVQVKVDLGDDVYEWRIIPTKAVNAAIDEYERQHPAATEAATEGTGAGTESAGTESTDAETKPAAPSVQTDFRGNPIPMKKDGAVDQTAFWNSDPEAWTKWNDEKRGDGGVNSMEYLKKAADKLKSDIKATQKKLDKETDFDRIDQLEQRKASLEERLKTLSDIQNGYRMQAAEAARQKAEEDAAKAKAARDAQAAELEKYNTDSLESIKEKWEKAPKEVGSEDTFVLSSGEEIGGHYVLTEAFAPTASHNTENGFAKTEGFPVDENGRTVNDRDYEHDKAAQQQVEEKAASYDQRALQTPVVVSQDGVVLSGNDRTMASQIAARQGTDTKYNEYLAKHAQKYGFTPEQVAGFKNPRVVFVPNSKMPYDAATFAKFNAEDKKTQSKTESAVKAGKVVPEETVERIAQIIDGHESIAETYADEKAVAAIIRELVDAGIIQKNEISKLMDGSLLSGTGEDLVESVILGAVLREDALRCVMEDKAMRRSIMSALTQLIKNSSYGEYSLMDEFSAAVVLLYQAKKSGLVKIDDKVANYLDQPVLEGFGENPVASATIRMLADIVNSRKVNELKNIISLYNARAAMASTGQADLFLGDVESREQILTEIIAEYERRNNAGQQAAVSGGNEKAGSPEEQAPDAVRGETGSGETEEGIVGKNNNGFSYFPGSLNELIKYAKGKAKGLLKKIISPVSSRLKLDLKQIGLEISDDYKHTIDNSAILHIINHHSKASEAKRGQVPITEDDIQKIEDIVNNYDKVELGNKNGDLQTIVYSKTYGDGTTIYIEEKRSKHKELAAITMWKKRTPTQITDESTFGSNPLDGSLNKPAPDTPEATPSPRTSEDKDTQTSGKTSESAEKSQTETKNEGQFGLVSDERIQPADERRGNLHKGEVEADNQGNPLNEDGTLKVDGIQSIDEITDADFTAPTRSVQLPKIPRVIDDAIGADGKPVVIKKNIFERNAETHPEVTPQQAREILTSALYRPDLYGQNQKKQRPYNWIIINTKDSEGQNRLVVLEVNANKDNVEIVHWYSVDDRGVDKIKRQAKKEGGHILTLPSETEEAGALSGRQSGLSSNSEEVYNRHTTVKQSAETVEVSQDETQSGTSSSSSMNASTHSEGKDTQTSGKASESAEKSQPETKNEGQFGLVSDERMAELKKRLLEKIKGQLNSGFDPELLSIGMEMAAGYIDRGIKTFVDFSKAMVADFGDAIRPYLKAFYNGAREMPGMEQLSKEMDAYDSVSAADVNSVGKEKAKEEETYGQYVARRAKEVGFDERINQSVSPEADEQGEIIGFGKNPEIEAFRDRYGEVFYRVYIENRDDGHFAKREILEKEGYYPDRSRRMGDRPGHVEFDTYDEAEAFDKLVASGKFQRESKNKTKTREKNASATEVKSTYEKKTWTSDSDIAEMKERRSYLDRVLEKDSAESKDVFPEEESFRKGQKDLRDHALSMKEDEFKKEADAFAKKYKERNERIRAIYDELSNLNDSIAFAEQKQQEKAQEEEKAKKKEAMKSKYNGFLNGKSPMQAAAIDKALSKRYWFGDESLSSAEFIEKHFAAGDLKVETKEEQPYPARVKWNRMTGEEQKAWMQSHKPTTSYFVNQYELGKQAYEYAKFLEGGKSEGVESKAQEKRDELFGLKPVAEISSAEDISSNIQKLVGGLVQHEDELGDTNSPYSAFGGFVGENKFERNAQKQVEEYVRSLNSVSKEITDKWKEQTGITDINSLNEHASKLYKENKSQQDAANKQKVDEGKRAVAETGRSTEKQSEKIDDVGEKIAGARKDLLSDYAKKLNDANIESLITMQFSKVFKRPNLNKAVETGALRPKDARFAEAVIAATLSTAKPLASKSRSRYQREKREREIKDWAQEAFSGISTLKALFEADETQRDAIIDKTLNEKAYEESEIEAQLAKLRAWNKGMQFNGECKPLNMTAIFYKAYEQIGANTYGDMKSPIADVHPDPGYRYYAVKDANGNPISPTRQLLSEQDVIDEIVYATKVANGDENIDHPDSAFKFSGKEPIYENDGYRVIYSVKAFSTDLKEQKFKTREEAQEYLNKIQERGYTSYGVSEVKNWAGYGKYTLSFTSPYREGFEIPEVSFSSIDEARASLDENRDEYNRLFNKKISEGKPETEKQKSEKVSVQAYWNNSTRSTLYGVFLADRYTVKTAFNTMPYAVREGFATRKEAEAYLNEHKAEIEAQITNIEKKRREFTYFDGEAKERIGEDYRKGKDVTAEEFRAAFGFRGVQFGNWTNQQDRQAAINNAYDSLMDLAKILEISPKAISLNGELGIAFGSRGTGKASAHYELDEVVINLTKTKGAGSLAHEWWHALDNYFARQNNVAMGMVTDSRNIKMRDEMREAYDRLLDNLAKSDYDRRSRQVGSSYWGSKHEETARMFEIWTATELSERGERNHFLVSESPNMEENFARINYENYRFFFALSGSEGNPMSFEEFMKRPEALQGFVYPTQKEMETFGKDLRNIFDTAEERIDEETGNVALFQKDSEEYDNSTPEKQLAFDAVSEMLNNAGVQTEILSNEEMEQLAEGSMNDASLSQSRSPRARWLDSYVEAESRFLGKSKKEARAEILQKMADAKKEAKELYEDVLSGNFNAVTLQRINDYIDSATPRNIFYRPLSQRLPERALLSLPKGERTGSVDALFSRICESTVPANGRTRADGRREIEARKEELLEKWAKATGNWHESIADFTGNTEAFGSGTDSEVFLSDDGTKVIKASKGKFDNRKHPSDIDQVTLFDSVFPGSAYRILGYGRLNGNFVRFLEQPFVDFSTSKPLTTEERVTFMEGLGFAPLNEEKTLFTNGELIVSDLQKSNIVKDAAGNTRVIDADVKLHTKDLGGNYTYPPVETDTDTAEFDSESGNKIEFLQNGSTVYGAAVGGKILLNAERLNPNTPIHEYTHLWDAACRQRNPELWKRGVELMKQTPLWDEIKNDPNYAGLDEDGIAGEVHARLAGENGAETLERMSREVIEKNGGFIDKAAKLNVIQKLRNWLSEFWYWVKNTMTQWSKDEADKVSIEDFVNMPLADLAKGTRLNESQRNAEERDIVEKAKADGTYMKAPNGKASNLNERQWVQVRTKAFKKWFGDWELPTKHTNIVNADGQHGFKDFKTAKKWAKEHIARTYTNDETGGKGDIRISGSSIEKFLSESSISKSDSRNVHLSVLKVLPDIIRESIDAEQHPDYKKSADGVRSPQNGINENVTIHRLYGAVVVDGKVYRVKVTVKEDRTNAEAKKAYNYEATKIELLSGHNEEAVTSSRNSNNSISAAKLLKDVEKSYVRGQNLLDSSKVVDENGEPRVVYHGTDSEFTVFDPEKGDYLPSWEPASKWTDKHRCFYFTGLRKMAESYKGASQLKEVFLNIRDAFEFDGKGSAWSDLRPFDYKPYEGEDIVKLAKATYDNLLGQSKADAARQKLIGEKGGETDAQSYFKKSMLVQLYKDYKDIENSKPKNTLDKVIRSLRLAIAVRNMEKRKNSYKEFAKAANFPFRESAMTFRTRDLDLIFSDKDGIIMKSIYDYGNKAENPEPGDVFVVYDSNNIKSATDNSGEFSIEDNDIRFHIVTDKKEIDRLNSEPTMKVYRGMQLVDGKLYPPMSAKVNGEWREGIDVKDLGKVWEQADENPELADDKGNFKLDKGNKSSLKARYNPYIHTSTTPLNDQFSSAQSRPELVTVEVEIPKSELTSGYKAEKAKDSVGKVEWKAGVIQSQLTGTRTVILSRWDKPMRIVPDSEVADVIVKMFGDKKITMPSNVVTPSLRAELEKRGIPFVETDNTGKPVTRFRDDSNDAYDKAVADGDIDTAQRIVDAEAEKKMEKSVVRNEDGTLKKVYHGSRASGFTVFDKTKTDDGRSLFFTDNKDIAKGYAETEGEEGSEYSVYLDMRKPLVIDADGARWNGLNIAGVRWILEGTENPTLKKILDRINRQGATFDYINEESDVRYKFDYDSGRRTLYELFSDEEMEKIEDELDPMDIFDYIAPKLDGKGKCDIYTNTRTVSELAEDAGYDGVIFNNIIDGASEETTETVSNVYAVFDPSAVKSADAVTMDNDGNIIPPSERFNREDEDIRYREDEIASMETPILESKGTFKNLAEAEKWAKENLQGKSETNQFTGMSIGIGRKSISEILNEKSLNKSDSIDIHLCALRSVFDFIKYGIPAEIHSDAHGRGFDVMRLYSAIRIGNESYRVKSTIRKVKEGDKYYTYEVQKMELTEERQANWKSGGETTTTTDSSINSISSEERRPSREGEGQSPRNPNSSDNYISGANLLKGVKKTNSDELILPIETINDRFDEELKMQAEGTLPEGHIYQLGRPSDILLSTGIPNLPIELSATRLAEKSGQRNHLFDILDVAGLPKALWKPLAVFSYGDKAKAQNVIVGLKKDGKQFVVGIHFNQERRGLLVNDIRGLFNKNNAEWLNWISQGKSLYLNKTEIQALIDQQRTNLAEVEYLDLDSVTKILNDFENPKVGANNESGEMMRDEEARPTSFSTEHSRSTAGKKLAAEETAKTIGVGFEYISRDELPEGHKGAKGMWRDGKIYICAENNADADDVKRTILHEAVGHMGLRRLIGDKNMGDFCMQVYRMLPKSERTKIANAAAQKYGLNFEKATEEYLAEMAETFDSSEDYDTIWDKIRAVLRNALAKIGINLPLSERDVRWILWQSYNANRQGDLINQAKRQVVADRLGFSFRADNMRQHAAEGIRFRDMNNNAVTSAANLYNTFVSRASARLHEGYVDMFNSVNTLVDAIEKQTGRAAAAFEDIRLALNQQSSKALATIEHWERTYYTPLMETIKGIIKKSGLSSEEVDRYAFLKHGLERNVVLAKRDAKQYYEEKLRQKVRAIRMSSASQADKDAKIQKAKDEYDRHCQGVDAETDSKYLKLRDNDYSGLTSLYSTFAPVSPRGRDESNEEYQARVLASRTPMYDNLKDVEDAARKEVANLESKIGSAGVAELWKRTNAATKATLRHQYDSGMLTKEQYGHARDMFQYYVPMRGFADNTAEDMYTYYASSRGGFTPPLQTAKGRKSQAASPWGYIGAMASSAVAADSKNEAKLTLYYFASNRPENDLVTISDVWYEKTGIDPATGKTVFTPVYPTFSDSLDKASAKAALDKWEQDMQTKSANGEAFKGTRKLDLKNSVIHIDKENSNSHVIRVKVNGQDKMMFINGNPRAAQAINNELNLDAVSGPITNGAQAFLRHMAAFNTSYNPEFWISNLQRDLLFSLMAVDVKEDADYRNDFLRNLRRSVKVFKMLRANKDGKLGTGRIENAYREFVDNGGVTGFTVVKDNEEWEQTKREFLADKNKAVQGVANALGAIQDLGESIEQMTRFAAYLTSREHGKDIREAISDAKELTVNFNRKGSGKPISIAEARQLTDKNGKQLSKAQQCFYVLASSMSRVGRLCVMFFNAGVQGLNTMYQLWKKDHRKTTMWMAGYFALGVINAVLHSLFDDDDDYLDMPEYERRNNALLGGNGYYFKWALPQESRVFYAMGDVLVNDMILGRNPQKKTRGVGDIVESVFDVMPVNPMNGWRGVMPEIARPLVEIAMNEDYKGEDVHRDSRWLSDEEKELTPKYKQAYDSTPKPYVYLSMAANWASGGDSLDSGFLNLYPEDIQHLVEGYSGGLGTFVNRLYGATVGAVDSGARSAAKGKGFAKGVMETASIRTTPFLNRLLIVNDERRRNAHTSEVFNYYKAQAEHTKRLIQEAKKSGDEKAIDKIFNDDERLNVYTFYEAYKKLDEAYFKLMRLTDDDTERRQIMREQDEIRKEMIEEIAKENKK